MNEALRRARALGAAATVLALAACGARSVGVRHARTTTTTRPPTVAVSPVELLSFVEVAINDGKGDTTPGHRGPRTVNKWTADIHIDIEGTPTPADREHVQSAAAMLSLLMAPRRVLVGGDATVHVHFTDKAQWPALLGATDYPPDADGVAEPHVQAGQDPGVIVGADIVIDTALPQVGRNRIITHELIHAVGINHSSCKSSVMFPTGGEDVSPLWSASELDRRMIALLYRPEITPGMSGRQVLRTLAPVNADGATCDPPRWELIQAVGTGIPYFCRTGPERYRPCTRNTTVEPTDPIAHPDLWYDGTFVYDRPPSG